MEIMKKFLKQIRPFGIFCICAISLFLFSCKENEKKEPSIRLSAVSGNTTEEGGTAYFTVALGQEPLLGVKVKLASSDSGEGKISPSVLYFNNSNYSLGQRITITGQDDTVLDNDQSYTIKVTSVESDDFSYGKAEENGQSVKVINEDNEDDPGKIIFISSNNRTTEDGDTTSFQVKLGKKPLSTVKVEFVSSDINEGRISPSKLTFSTSNYSVAQTITVTGQDDSILDDNQDYKIRVSEVYSNDQTYTKSVISLPSLEMINEDNETTVGEIKLDSTSGKVTTENGGTDTFMVSLSKKPTSKVYVEFTSSDTTEGKVDPAVLTFTPSNYYQKQAVTIIGQDDESWDNNQSYTIRISDVQSTDPAYKKSNLTLGSVDVVNQDKDSKKTALGRSEFAVIRASSQCPAGFNPGLMQMDTEDNSNRDTVTIPGKVVKDGTYLNIPMCTTSTDGLGNLTALGKSKFWVLRSGSCPTGYKSGTIQIDTEDDNPANSIDGEVGSSSIFTDKEPKFYDGGRYNMKNIKLEVCESNNDSNLTNLLNSSFTIFKKGSCPEGSKPGRIHVDTEDDRNRDQTSGDIGDSDKSDDNKNSFDLEVCTFVR